MYTLFMMLLFLLFIAICTILGSIPAHYNALHLPAYNKPLYIANLFHSLLKMKKKSYSSAREPISAFALANNREENQKFLDPERISIIFLNVSRVSFCHFP